MIVFHRGIIAVSNAAGLSLSACHPVRYPPCRSLSIARQSVDLVDFLARRRRQETVGQFSTATARANAQAG